MLHADLRYYSSGDGCAPACGDNRSALLYIGMSLPSRSETFVYRELIAIRERGMRVFPVSVRIAGSDLGEPALAALRDEAIALYSLGAIRLFLDAVWEALRHPWRVLSLVAVVLIDCLRPSAHGTVRRLKLLWQAVAAMALARRVRSLNVRHIHAHMAHVPTTIAMYSSQLLGATFSFTGHANDLFVNSTLLPEKLRRASFVACISHWHRAFYRKLLDLPDERLPIVRCGVDVPREPATFQVRGVPRILAVGRLVPKKGFDVLLRALGALRRSGCRVECGLVGDGPERAYLHELLVKFQLADSVQFLGSRSNLEVISLLRDSDLLVLPCRIAPDGDRDGIPVVLMEAMAAGVCVISGDQPAIRELVRDGVTGVLVPPDDAQALEGAIRELLRDPARRSSLGAAGHTWVQQEFSGEVNIERLLSSFASVGVLSVRDPRAGQPAGSGS